MFALLFSTLFAASACLALGAIGSSWRSHGAAVAELGRQLRACRRTRDLRYKLISTTVRLGNERPAATICRVDFTAASRSLGLRLTRQPELRAAA